MNSVVMVTLEIMSKQLCLCLSMRTIMTLFSPPKEPLSPWGLHQIKTVPAGCFLNGSCTFSLICSCGESFLMPELINRQSAGFYRSPLHLNMNPKPYVKSGEKMELGWGGAPPSSGGKVSSSGKWPLDLAHSVSQGLSWDKRPLAHVQRLPESSRCMEASRLISVRPAPPHNHSIKKNNTKSLPRSNSQTPAESGLGRLCVCVCVCVDLINPVYCTGCVSKSALYIPDGFNRFNY